VAAVLTVQTHAPIADQLHRLHAAFRKASGVGSFARIGTEASWDYAGLALWAMGPAVLLLAPLGLASSLRRRTDHIWNAAFVVLAGVIVFGIGHNEVRYLFPLVPLLIFAVVRGLETAAPWHRAVAPALVALTAGSALWSSIDQVRLDVDAFFFKDLQGRIARRMVEVRRSPGGLVWTGPPHTHHPSHRTALKGDEFFGVFHLAATGMTYLAGEATVRRPGNLWHDGDAVFAGSKTYRANDLPAGGVPPAQVWAVRRRDFDRAPEPGTADASPESTFVEHGTGARLSVAMVAGKWRLVSASDLGRWDVVLDQPGGSQPLGTFDLVAGRAVDIAPPHSNAPNRVILFQIDRQAID